PPPPHPAIFLKDYLVFRIKIFVLWVFFFFIFVLILVFKLKTALFLKKRAGVREWIYRENIKKQTRKFLWCFLFLTPRRWVRGAGTAHQPAADL
ncbi:hypothetical protein, partial [Enterobacter intestinihominis]